LVVAQGLLHEAAEDDGADPVPVEPVAGREQGVSNRVGEPGYLDVLGEQSAVDVREPGEFGFEVSVAFLRFGVERCEQVDDAAAQAGRVERFDVPAERALWEQSGILGVQTEYEPDGEDGEAVMRSQGVGVGVLGGDGGGGGGPRRIGRCGSRPLCGGISGGESVKGLRTILSSAVPVRR